MLGVQLLANPPVCSDAESVSMIFTVNSTSTSTVSLEASGVQDVGVAIQCSVAPTQGREGEGAGPKNVYSGTAALKQCYTWSQRALHAVFARCNRPPDDSCCGVLCCGVCCAVQLLLGQT